MASRAVGLAVEFALAHRQQLARLRVEDEDEPVEQDEAVVVGLFQHLRRGLQRIAGIIEKPLRKVPQRIIHLALQRVADAMGILHAGA